MEKLADKGNGNYAYIDTPAEARKVLGEQLGATLHTIAKDVKIQVEFNPRAVAGYRLIGYENRALRDRDFNDDRVDAGEIGAGHTVTALYEIIPAGGRRAVVDPLRYQPGSRPSVERGDEIAFVRLRYKLPRERESRLIEQPVRASTAFASLKEVPAEQRFAVAVAAFGQRLRGETALDGYSYGDIAALANSARGADPEGYRAEVVRLVRMAEILKR